MPRRHARGVAVLASASLASTLALLGCRKPSEPAAVAPPPPAAATPAAPIPRPMPPPRTHERDRMAFPPNDTPISPPVGAIQLPPLGPGSVAVAPPATPEAPRHAPSYGASQSAGLRVERSVEVEADPRPKKKQKKKKKARRD